MRVNLTEREQEVLRLYEEERQTFQVIAQKYGISNRRASQIYHDADRKRRQAYRMEQRKRENGQKVTLTLTKGELFIIRDMLDEYMLLRTKEIRHSVTELSRVKEESRYQEAERLSELLKGILEPEEK